MNMRTRLLGLALAAVPFVAGAAEGEKLSCINDVTYSQTFLSQFPNAGAACREVVVKQGEKWIRFTSRVKGVKEGKHLAVEFLNVAGDPLGTITFAPNADASVTVND